MTPRWARAIVGGILFLTACAHTKIPNTMIDDTDENRMILEVVEGYRRAVESLDSDAVLKLVSPTFYEDNGNTDKTDDYDFRGLQDTLRAQFDATKKIQLEMRVDDVVVEENKAYAFVYYTYRAQSDYPSGTKWKTDSDRSRFEFENQAGKWLIISGI